MTTSEILQRERTEAERRGEIYIYPWRMEQLMGIARRVVSVITNSHQCMNYYEMDIILRMAEAVIRETNGKET